MPARPLKYSALAILAGVLLSSCIVLETSQLETEISGSGSMYLSGVAEQHRARISGSGKIDALNMRARNAAVSITGSGDCLLTALDRLYAKISGTGNALYKGHPQIGKTITGSGKVRQIN